MQAEKKIEHTDSGCVGKRERGLGVFHYNPSPGSLWGINPSDGSGAPGFFGGFDDMGEN